MARRSTLVPGLRRTRASRRASRRKGDAPQTVAACELVLEALVARKKISRSDGGTLWSRGAGEAATAAERRTSSAADSPPDAMTAGRPASATTATRERAAMTARSRRRRRAISTPWSRFGSRCCASIPIIRSTAGCARTSSARARELFAAQLRSPTETIFLAERGGEVVGILRCVESMGSPLLEPARYAYVSSVYVRPEARRRGVLRALRGAAETLGARARARADAAAQRRRERRRGSARGMRSGFASRRTGAPAEPHRVQSD